MNQPILTEDGSLTFHSSRFNDHYHSTHGAVTESQHVFIENGLRNYLSRKEIYLLEIGLGTGLNAYLTSQFSGELKIHYEALEPYPLSQEEQEHLKDSPKEQKVLHQCSWGEWHQLKEGLYFQKHQMTLEDFQSENLYDLIYFDAFKPDSQPELWTFEVFQKIYQMSNKEAYLVTYCAKGDVRRAMEKAGFEVQRLKGPPGKREMLRARKG